MKNGISHHDFQDMAIENHYPIDFGGLDDVNERLKSGRFFFGEGEYKEFFFKGFHIGYGNFSFKKPMRMQMECDYQTVEMNFIFSGKILIADGQSSLYSETMPNQHNIFYINSFQGHSHWHATKGMLTFVVKIVPELFLKYLPIHDARFNAFREKIERGETCVFSPYNYRITQAMQWIIRDIITCQRNGIFKRMYLESKITELLILQLEQMSDKAEPMLVNLNSGLVDKMMVVKEFIETHDLELYSLSDLAKVAETNECTLKKAFKQMFGTTVFGYYNQLKMAEAKTLLIDGGISVTQVAKRLGYKNPQHFTKAFKRAYGHVPSKWIYKTWGTNKK